MSEQHPSLREEAWAALVERLELKPASERARRRLKRFLNLEGETAFGPVYRSALDVGAEERAALILFEYTSSRSGVAPQLTSGCMLSLPHEVSRVSLKVSRKLHRVLESLGASATGSQVVQFPADTDFGSKVTVYARAEEEARSVLSKPVRAVLQRALYTRGVEPTLLLGEKQLLFSYPVAEGATELGALELLTTDLLSLYALVPQAHDPS